MSTQILNISRAFTNLQDDPVQRDTVSRRDSQIIYGEEFETTGVIKNGWAEGRSVLDGYEGWVHCNDLTETKINTNHAVNIRMTNAYPEPNFKMHPSLTMTFMSRVHVDASVPAEKGFVSFKENERTLWVPENDLVCLGDLSTNPVDIVDNAMTFAGCPFGYGGRSAWGIDCAAVVQLALQRNGIYCPRDTDIQMPILGRSVSISDIQRGDIIYFKGHAAIMVDLENVFNATARHMRAIVEPLAVLREKYSDNGAEAILDIRRVDIPQFDRNFL